MLCYVHYVSKYEFVDEKTEREIKGVKVAYFCEPSGENDLGNPSIYFTFKDLRWYDYFKQYGVPGMYDIEFKVTPGKNGPKLEGVSVNCHGVK